MLFTFVRCAAQTGNRVLAPQTLDIYKDRCILSVVNRFCSSSQIEGLPHHGRSLPREASKSNLSSPCRYYTPVRRLSLSCAVTMSENNEKCFEVALKLTKQAGALVRERIWSSKNVNTKASTIDYVTETDTEVEKLLISGIKDEFPNHKFIGEESSSSKIEYTADPTWIIDPVDGTMNFVHGNPFVCISVGFCVNKEPQVGIIYVPVIDQMFTAIRGKGAQMDGREIKVSGQTELSKSLVIYECGTDPCEEKRANTLKNVSTILPHISGFRSYGSAAFNMAMVASGAVDAYFEFGPHAWDMAAGQLIISEAGGVVIDPSGGPLDFMSRRMLCASSEPLSKALMEKIVQYYPKRDD